MMSFFQPRAWFRTFLILTLAVSSCFSQPSRNPDDQEIKAITSQWRDSSNASKAVLLSRIYDLRDYVSDPALVSAHLTRLATDAGEDALIRDEADWHLAQIALHEGRLDDAGKIADQLGFVRNWGRVSATECSPASLDNKKMAELKSAPLGTLTVHGSESGVCVATAVNSTTDVNVAVRFGANSPAMLYVNGSQAAKSEKAQEFGFDQASVGVRLKAGWNTLAIVIPGDDETKQFGLRITALNGGGLSLQSDMSRVSGQVRPLSTVEVSDLLEDATDSNASAEDLDIIAALEQLRGFGPDSDKLEAAAKLAPTAQRWLAVANACSDQSCTFSALSRALAIDANYAPSKIALARYYTSRGQLEKSRDLLKQVVASDPNNFMARRQLAAVYIAAGATSLAMNEYRQLETAGDLPLCLKREIALRFVDLGVTGKATELLNDVWKSDFDDDQVRTALTGLAERRGDRATLQMLAEAAQKLDPMDQQAAFDVVRYSSEPQPIESAQIDNAELHRQYAEMLAFQGKQNASRAQLVQAAKLDGRIQLPRDLAGSEDQDSTYLADPAKLAADVRRNPPTENSNVVSLADINIERVLSTGQSVLHAQQVFYIANDRGARDYGVRSIQYSHASQKLSVISARVYKSDGRVLEAEDQGENSVADTSVAMYYDTRSRSFRFPTLQKGDLISLEYRISPNSNVNPYGNYFGTFVAFQNGLPQRLRRYVLIASSDRKLNIVEQRMPVHAAVTQNGSETVYCWDVTQVAPLASEPRGPSLTEVAPYVSVSTFENWNQLGRWYAKMITPQFTLDSDLREALARITANTKTETEKIHAIHEFVLRNTHYVAMEFGVYSYKPYPVSQVYARRFGDCKDKASLMIALLRAAGIDADLALVRTRKLGDVSDRATNIAIFNHAVAYIPKYDLWLDGTAEYAGSRELPLDDQGAMALTVNLNGNAMLRRIPTTLPMQNYTHRVVRAEVQKDGNIIFSGSAYTRGEDAPGLRREYELADRQRDTVRANLAQVYPSVRVDAVHVDGAEDIERDINVKFSGSLDKFIGNRVLGLTSSWLPHQYVNSLASKMSRTQDLILPAPWTTEEELHFDIPQSASIDSLPKNLDYETPYGTAVIRYERNGRELVVTTSVQFRKLRITPSEYAGFRNFCSEVEKAFRREVKVRLAS